MTTFSISFSIFIFHPFSIIACFNFQSNLHISFWKPRGSWGVQRLGSISLLHLRIFLHFEQRRSSLSICLSRLYTQNASPSPKAWWLWNFFDSAFSHDWGSLFSVELNSLPAHCSRYTGGTLPFPFRLFSGIFLVFPLLLYGLVWCYFHWPWVGAEGAFPSKSKAFSKWPLDPLSL